MTTRLKALMAIGGTLLLILILASCGGSGGSGSGGSNGGDQNGGGAAPPDATTVTIRGVVYARSPMSPLAQALCRFVNPQNGQQLATTTASLEGAFELSVPPDVQGFIQCHPPSLPRLTLSTFVSTVGQSPGSTISGEDVTAATTVIREILSATVPVDPQVRKEELVAALAAGESSLMTLVDAAALLYERLLAVSLDTATGFSGESGDAGESAEGGGDGGDADGGDGGGADGEAGDGGEFSPIPNAECTFTLDQDGKIGAHTALADLFADGRVDLADLQAIANPLHTTLNAERRRAITSAFAELFPTGLGQPLRTIADGESSATPGRYFLPLPPGVPGIIRCHPPQQANLVLTTCVRARATNEILTDQDVTPRTTVVCDVVTEVLQAKADADRETIKVDLLSRLEPLRILLSEDRNGNGSPDPDEVDEDGDGEINTLARITSDTPVIEEDRDLTLLASMATTIFDTMRIANATLSAEQTFAEAREEFFTNGSFSEPLAPIAPGVESALMDAANQAVLGTTDVVRAARTGTLRGTVSDENGLPLAGVEVVVTQDGNEVDVADNPAITAADGTFSIRTIPVGEATVTAFLDGFDVLTVTTTIVAIVTIDIELSPVPQIAVGPSSLTFGNVMVGETRALPVTIDNIGTAPLTLTALEVETPGTPQFVLDQAPTLPVIVAPGAEVTLGLLYQPTMVGPALGSLRVISDAVNASEATVALSGVGVPQPVPHIDVQVSSLTFEEVEVGTVQTKSVTIRNTGTATLSLIALEVETSGTPQFALGQAPTLPLNLMPEAAVTVALRYQPTTEGAATGALHISSNAANAPLITVALSGIGTAAPVPQVDVSPAAVAFGDVEMRTSPDISVTVTRSVTIRNTGTAPLTLTALEVVTSDTSQLLLGQAPTLPVSLASGAAVTVAVLYRPTTVGSVTGTLRISSDAANTPFVSVSLTGTGIAVPVPQIDVSPAAVAFGEVTVGATRLIPVTITNPGSAALTLMDLAVAGSEETGITLRRAPTLPVTVIPGAMVTLDMVYQPVAEGSVTATLRIRSDATNTPRLTIPLSGTGAPVPLPQIDVSLPALAFGNVTVGATHTIPVMITNSGSAPLTLMDLEVGTAAIFRLSDTPSLPTIVAPGAEVTFDVVYQPTAPGTVTDVLHITTDAADTPDVTVSLSGTGVMAPIPQIDVNPAAVAFGDVTIGESHTLPVMIKNTGTASLTLTALQIDVDASAEPAFMLVNGQPGSVVVEPGGEMPVQVTYQPSMEGTVTGTLRISSNAADAPVITVALSGTGVPIPVPLLEVTPATLSFGEVVVGEERTRTLILHNPGTADLHLMDVAIDNTAAFSLPGFPALPSTVGPGEMVTIDVTFAPPTDDTLTGTLRLHSDATHTPEAIVTLRGTGIPASGSTGGTD